jgi:hypothetical protein
LARSLLLPWAAGRQVRLLASVGSAWQFAGVAPATAGRAPWDLIVAARVRMIGGGSRPMKLPKP